MQYNWNHEKDKQLQSERGVSFADVVEAVHGGNLLADIDHPNQEKYSHQHLLIVKIKNYAYIVPYVIEENGTKFLKTIYPARKASKKYLSKS